MRITSTDWQDVEKVVRFCQENDIGYQVESVEDIKDITPINVWNSLDEFRKKLAFAKYNGVKTWYELVKICNGLSSLAEHRYQKHLEKEGYKTLMPYI